MKGGTKPVTRKPTQKSLAEKAATAALLNSARKRAQEPFEKVIEGQEKGGEYFTHQKVNYYTFKTDM